MAFKQIVRGVLEKTDLGRALLVARRKLKEEKRKKAVLNSSYTFIDRQKNREKLCVVLAGYKQPIWDDVFARLAAFVPDDVDVCIMTSGLVDAELQALAEKNDWSYLSTEINQLTHIQNLAIKLHPHAQWIYKIDEDIFLTKGFFEKLFETWNYIERETYYIPAFVAPLINVNGYSSLRLLDKLDLVDDFRNTGYMSIKYSEGLRSDDRIAKDPQIAKYLWGDTQPVLRDIDALTARFSAEPLAYSICPIRFSIGAIFFSRENWEQFGGFPILLSGSGYGLGDDEEHICAYAPYYGKEIIINENVVIGHLSYGLQNEAMMNYYANHRDFFALPAK